MSQRESAGNQPANDTPGQDGSYMRRQGGARGTRGRRNFTDAQRAAKCAGNPNHGVKSTGQHRGEVWVRGYTRDDVGKGGNVANRRGHNAPNYGYCRRKPDTNKAGTHIGRPKKTGKRSKSPRKRRQSPRKKQPSGVGKEPRSKMIPTSQRKKQSAAAATGKET